MEIIIIGGDTNTTNTEPAQTSPSDDTTNEHVRAIAGGTVAAVFVLVVSITAVIIIILCVRKKKRKALSTFRKSVMRVDSFDSMGKLKDKEVKQSSKNLASEAASKVSVKKSGGKRRPEEEEPFYVNIESTGRRQRARIALQASTRPAVSADKAESNQNVEEHNFIQEVVYADPEPAQRKGNIYVYEMKSLTPSAFMRESVGHDYENLEELYPCSSIYTVPETTTEEKPLEVTKENIEVMKTLGSGNFGDVVLARTVGLSGNDLKISPSTDTNIQVYVAVKLLKSDANMSDRSLFEKECKFTARLNDPNVICLLGVCKTTTPFIMMEYMENGDLNHFLKSYKTVVHADTPKCGSEEINTATLTSMCTQIASAMKYLASKNFVHRDLATRNCLVGSNYQVKIADFGMSRSMYESHYYVIKGYAVLPIRWMATECFFGQFSAKTDVWAFGVTMWEIFELAKNQPYHEMDDRELVGDVIKGASRKLLPRPKACPKEVYRVMRLCWGHKSSERQTFENLYQTLSTL